MTTARTIERLPQLLLAVALGMAAIVAAACDVPAQETNGATNGNDEPIAGDPVEFDIELADLYVSPSSIEVPAGAEVVLNVTNVGALPHDLVVRDGPGTAMLNQGESETVTVGPFTSNVEMICTVPGHEAAGMVLEVVVTDAAVAEPTPHDDGPAAPSGTYATVDPNAAPDDDWQPFNPVLQPAPDATVHEVTFHMTETEIEVG